MRKARESVAEIEDIRLGLVALRRLFQRRELVALWAAATGTRARLDYGEVRLLDAIQAASRDQGVTVGAVARLLGIDPSRASRQVARAVARGLLRREAEQRDGRVVRLAITARGAAVQARGSALTRARIRLALARWPAEDRARFAALFARFAAAIVA
jgi:DNA-binding MarR family transcriptional regulator